MDVGSVHGGHNCVASTHEGRRDHLQRLTEAPLITASAFAAGWGGTLARSSTTACTPTFTEPAGLAGIQAAVRLLPAGGPLQATWTDISPIGNWLVQYQNAKFDWSLGPLPTLPKGRRTQAGYICAVVSRHTEQSTLATRFVLALYAAQHQQTLALSGAGLPVRPAAGAALLAQLLRGHVQGATAICDPTGDVPPNEALGAPAAGDLQQRLLLESDLGNALDALYRGMPMTTAEALALAARAIATGKDLSCTQGGGNISACVPSISGNDWTLYAAGVPVGL